MKDTLKEIGAQIAHLLLCMLVLAPVVFMPGAWRILGGAMSGYLVGFIREDAQHRTPDQTPEGWGWWLKGLNTYSGRHRDMTAFALGGLIDGALYWRFLG